MLIYVPNIDIAFWVVMIMDAHDTP